MLSDEVEEKIADLLGHPTRDPHGSPIPDRHGNMPEVTDVQLVELQKGQQAVIMRVNSDRPELLRYLGSLSLYPNTKLIVVDVAPFEGPLTINVNGKELVLGRRVAENIFVEVKK